MAPVSRGWASFFVDRLFGWWSGLPGESCSYTVEALRIPIVGEDSQEISLAANLYRPTIPNPHGTIMVRTSYGIGPLMALGHARLFASRGYQVLLAACRGTDPSDGQTVEFGTHEAADGLATVSWMRKQSWYTGSFATFGGSYLGYTQYALLSEPPADMKAAVINSGMCNLAKFIWATGAQDGHLVAWGDLMTAGKRGIAPGPAYIKTQPTVLKPVYDGIPLIGAMDKHFDNDTPEWMKRVATHPDPQDPVYEKINHGSALEKLDLPILQTTGWNDIAITCVTEQYEAISKRGVSTFLTMGPWTHLGAQRGPNIVEGLEFIEHHLANRGKGFRTSPVKIFVTGAKEWRDLPSWPPTPKSKQELYLGPSNSLTAQKPSEITSSTFKFDPTQPTPNTGIPRPFDDMIPASYEDTSLAQRSDVVVFTGEPLPADVEVTGVPKVILDHSTDCPDADVLVRLSEVDKNGKSMRINDCYRRLDPKRGKEPLELDLWSCAHRFTKGNRIRIVIAGGSHPGYIRNLGTGENPGTGSKIQSVVHTVGPCSKIVLPVM